MLLKHRLGENATEREVFVVLSRSINLIIMLLLQCIFVGVEMKNLRVRIFFVDYL